MNDDNSSTHSDYTDVNNDNMSSQKSFGSQISSSIDGDSSDVSNFDFYEGNVDFKIQYDERKKKRDEAKSKNSDLSAKIYLIINNNAANLKDNKNNLDDKREFEKNKDTEQAVKNFSEALDKFIKKSEELHDKRNKYKVEIESFQSRSQLEEDRRLNKDKEFQGIREQATKNAILQRTNKPIHSSILSSKESKLAKADHDLQEYRINYILTKNRFKQFQEELDKQDQLSEGLHLIDFEQLKIENQSLNEKKAEKTQDREKIREKIIINSHILTHVIEKLAFVKKQKESLTKQQDEVDELYADSRNKLATHRIRRDKVRDENSTLKKSSGLIGMTDLLYDFENRANELEMMQDRVTELKTRYNDLIAMQHELEAKIAQRKPLDPNLLKMNR